MASVLVLVMTFIVSTLSFLTYDVMENTSSNMEDKVQIVGYVDSSESTYYKDTLIDDIESIPNVSEVELQESADELDEFLEDLDVGGELFEDVVDDNPLEDTLYIHLKDSAGIEGTYNQVMELDHFTEENVMYNQEGVDIVENLTVMFYVVIITLIVVVVAITVPIINILIKNSIDARSSEIRVKRLIGATKFTIISPILLELLIMFVISLGIYTAITYYLLQFIRDAIDSFGISMVEVGSLRSIMVDSLSVNIIFGLVLILVTLMYVAFNKIKV